MLDYAEVCEWHTTEQGLDPIVEALRAAGVPHTVDQTGGFVMCVRVPLCESDSPFLYVIASDEPGTCFVSMYWDCPDYHSEGEDVAYNLPLGHLAHSVRLLASNGPHPCPYCSGEQ